MPRAGVRSAITTTLGLLLLALTAASAPAASKPYSLTITPGTVAAGTQSTFTAHFAVPASASQQLGSADVTVPAGFTVVSASVPVPGTATVTGGTVRLRNLAVQPGHAVDATVVARAPCTAGTSSWTVLAKQANDFNGPPGNDLTLVGGLELADDHRHRPAAGSRCASSRSPPRHGWARSSPARPTHLAVRR